MKYNSLLVGLSVCLGCMGSVNASIVQGVVEDQLTNIYALPLDGSWTHEDFDAQCEEHLLNFFNTKFYAYYKIDTSAKSMSVLVTYLGTEVRLEGNMREKSFFGDRYSAFSTHLPDRFTQDTIKKISFRVNNSPHKHAALLIQFEPSLFHSYRCVLATEHDY